MNEIFPVHSLDRSKVHWEDYLMALTPCEFHHGVWFKRDDYFAPLGYGGINGSKLRQCIMVMRQWSLLPAGHRTVVSGASVKSPQLAMGAAVAKHYGFDCVHVIGATNPDSAIKRDMVQMAQWFGARFVIEAVAYNHNLQLKAQSLLKSEFPNGLYLEYGITLHQDRHPAKHIADFHNIGALQARNIPDEVTDVVISCGSANSATSLLMGLALFPPKNVRNVHLIGIGPSKLGYLLSRLQIIGRAREQDLLGDFKSVHNPKACENARYRMYYRDLHRMGLADYQDEVPYALDGIEFHPTYEGKVVRHVRENMPELMKPTTLFWIVGSKPRIESMAHLRGVLGEAPTKFHEYDPAEA
jgi:1-aminocyclopropane-1-carboxylate deaminase/D-cysteine desulfhydrase-like pyridoxal-dependent ACC family enzyme